MVSLVAISTFVSAVPGPLEGGTSSELVSADYMDFTSYIVYSYDAATGMLTPKLTAETMDHYACADVYLQNEPTVCPTSSTSTGGGQIDTVCLTNVCMRGFGLAVGPQPVLLKFTMWQGAASNPAWIRWSNSTATTNGMVDREDGWWRCNLVDCHFDARVYVGSRLVAMDTGHS